jgi:hypothetical protein
VCRSEDFNSRQKLNGSRRSEDDSVSRKDDTDSMQLPSVNERLCMSLVMHFKPISLVVYLTMLSA